MKKNYMEPIVEVTIINDVVADKVPGTSDTSAEEF